MAHLKPSKHKETISGSSLSLSATLNAANNGVHATYMKNRGDDREDERKEVRERRGVVEERRCQRKTWRRKMNKGRGIKFCIFKWASGE